jgi:hypothetical protein
MHNNNSRVDKLQTAIDGVSRPIFATGYNEVKQSYQDKYGQKSWIGKYVESLGLRTVGVKSKDDKPYLAARRSIERFEKGKQSSSTYADKETADKAGIKLGAILHVPKQNTINIVVHGTTKELRNGKMVDVHHSPIKASFSGSDAVAFVNEVYNPGSSGTGMNAYQMIWDDYGVDYDLFEDGDYELEVGSVSAT